MPFFRWDEMVRKNLAAPSDSEGSIIIGDFVTLNRSVSQPGKARGKTMIKQCSNTLTPWERVGLSPL